MVPKNGAKSKESKETLQDRRLRKRVQNRISQQCVREKQAAYSKQLEALAGMIKSSTTTDRESTVSHDANLKIQMALLEENRKLRDALLRMRKKMLSLSSAVGAVADDPIFEHILDKQQPKGNTASQKSVTGDSDDEEGKQSEEGKLLAENNTVKETEIENGVQQDGGSNQNEQRCRAMEAADDSSELSHREADVVMISDAESINALTQSTTLRSARSHEFLSVERSSLPLIRPHIDLDGMTLTETNTHESPESATSATPAISTLSLPPISDTNIRALAPGQTCRLPAIDGQDENMQDLLSLTINQFCYTDTTGEASWNDCPATDAHYLSNFEFIPEEPGYESPKFYVLGENSWRIEEACLRYLAQHYRIQEPKQSIRSQHNDIAHYNALRTAIAHRDFNDVVVVDVAKLAIDIMCKTSGFSQYIYGVGAHKDMEKVFRWRLSPSTRNRLLISDPFQPTPLQYMRNCSHSTAIDFVNWPSIRDQLIFKAGTYDFDRVIADIVANTVIEIPERRIAINIHDTFFTKIFARTTAAYFASSWLYSELGVRSSLLDDGIGEAWESSSSGQATLGWTSDDVFCYITQQIEALNSFRKTNSDMTTFNDCHPSSYNNHLTLNLTQPLASKWGLDKLYRWKLSKEFAQSYPFLDCTGVTASFPMYASRTVPDP